MMTCFKFIYLLQVFSNAVPLTSVQQLSITGENGKTVSYAVFIISYIAEVNKISVDT